MQNITELTTGEIKIDNNGYSKNLIKNIKRRVVPQAEIDANNIGALKWNGTDFVIDQVVIDADNQNKLDKIYANKLTEIKNARNNNIETGQFVCQVIPGFKVDCRRNGVDNDIQNVDQFIKGMIALGATTCTWVGVDTQQNMTLAQLQELQIEMILYGQGLFQKKQNLDKSINDIYNDPIKTVQEKITAIEAKIW